MPTLFITGANRGLGLEFVQQYVADGWHVFATCRDPDNAKALTLLAANQSRLTIVPLDVRSVAAIQSLPAQLDGIPIDLLINNAGVFGPKAKAENDPRQTLGHIDYDIWSDVLQTNTLAPIAIAEALMPNIEAGEHKKIVTISSVMGSIAMAGPGVYAYRSSKAAVNMAMRALACELEPKNIIVSVLNPGWVKTDMGGMTADVETADSIASMRHVIGGLSLQQSGQFFDYDGTSIAW